jgi:phage terminase small subunit
MPRVNGLTPKQARFVEEYLVDMNGAAAVRRAGYKHSRPDALAYDLLRKQDICDALNAAQRERSARTGITADRVLKEIARLAFADPRAVMAWGPNGVTLRESSELSDDEAAAVAEVSETWTDAGGGSRKVKLHDKVAALEKLARHVGLYEERGDTTIVINNPRGEMGDQT